MAFGLGGDAAAAGDDDAGRASYMGAFWSVALHGGLSYRSHAGDGESPGFTYGVSLRAATLMSLLDVELGLLRSAYDARGDDGAVRAIGRTSVALEAHLHPLFISHLQGSNVAFWLAALHVTVGAAIDVVSGPGDAQVAPAFLIGGGSDIPLGDVVHGWGLWLGLDYRYRVLGVDGYGPGLGRFDEHVFLLSIAYRDNDIGFARIPRPPELDDREPPSGGRR